MLATSDVPGGVVNVLTGSPAEIGPWLASHQDVNALDLAGAGALDWVDMQIAAAETLKRVLTPGEVVASPERIGAFTEIKTSGTPRVWSTDVGTTEGPAAHRAAGPSLSKGRCGSITVVL